MPPADLSGRGHDKAKIVMSYILTQPHPKVQVMLIKCESLYDLTAQVWLL